MLTVVKRRSENGGFSSVLSQLLISACVLGNCRGRERTARKEKRRQSLEFTEGHEPFKIFPLVWVTE